MAIIKKTLFSKNLSNYSVLVNDTDPTSKYFKISELPDTFTGGKNAFLIQGSEVLVPDTKIQIELKDSAGNVIYHEPGEGYISSSLNGVPFVTEYYEGVSKVVSVYVYPDTAYGPCTLTILGELNQFVDSNGITTAVPLEWENKYNVKWEKQINVNPSLANTTKIRFYQRPVASITEIISPIFRIESGSKVNSGINQSFANIKLSKLETFAGDVKRVKVFRTSEGDISDYDLIQDILVESKELLTTTQLSGSVIGNTGTFTTETLKNFWNTGSLNAQLTSSRVESGVKLTGSGNFRYTSSLDIKSANTYELNLDAFYSSSISTNLGIYLVSGSESSSIATLNGTAPTKNLLDTVIPFKIDKDFVSASLYFSQSRGEWHLGNISLKLSEDTAFSPDEISFITTMPTVIGNEDFNFKFEFYDVNNNFVPVAVTQSANFTGGSNAITKLLTFESDRTAFRFSTGSFANPPNQSVRFKTIKTNFTGSVTYASSAFDVGGNYIEPSAYAGTYPGTFVSQNDNGALLNISSFSGSVASVLVGSIVYTASCEGFTEFETIYRFEDGDNAPGVFVTANTNQFIYKATDLSLNPTGQVITLEAKRKNLASATTPLTVNSGSGKPPLTYVSTNTTNGVDTYTLSGTSYPYSTGETIYSISGSDQFGNQFSDAIKISPVKILDGLSVSLTNDNASIPARSTGFIESGSFVLSSGSVSVKVGNEIITHSNGLSANNRFDIVSAVATNVQTGSLNYSTTDYFISRLDADSGSLNLTIRYKDGGGDTSDTTKLVTYTKTKVGTPNVVVAVSPSAQSISSNSRGSGSALPTPLTITALEGGNSRFTSIGTPTYTNGLTGSISTNTITFTSTASSMFSDTGQVTIPVNYTDSEGISGTKNIIATISKAKTAVPNVVISATPQAQSVLANASGVQTAALTNVTITALEGSTSRFTSMTIAGTTGFSAAPTVSGNVLMMISAAMNAPEASVTLTVTHTDSEGTTGQTQTIVIRSTKVSIGANGDPGATGGNGPGVVFRGVWSSATTYYDTDDFPTRRDAVLYSGTYYATKTNATTNLNKQPDIQSTFWESLGTDSYFVAAEIAIFRESFVKQTINVGTNASGNANITIYGNDTSPYISIGQATKGYDNLGAFIGSNGTTGRLSLKSATNSLKWDGSTLDITGNINIAGGTAATEITNAAACGTNACAAALTANTAAGNANDKATHACNCSYTALSRSVDSTGKITFAPTPSGAGLFISSTNLGFYCNSCWKTYMTSGGCFFLSGAGTNSLTWDSCTLTINGAINIIGGTAATQISNAALCGTNACAAALSAVSCAGTAHSCAATAFSCGVQGKTDAGNANDKAIHACSCSYTALTRAVDSSGKITFNPTPPGTGSGLFMNATNLGYYCNGTWKTYMSNTGNFYLSGAGNNGLSWDGSTLLIDGNITARSGTFSGNISSTATISGGVISGARLTGGLIHMPNAQGINFFCMNLNGEFWLGPISSTYLIADRSYPAGQGGYCTGGRFVFWNGNGCADQRDADTNFAYNGDMHSISQYSGGAQTERSIQHTTRCSFYWSRLESFLYMRLCVEGLYVAGDIVAGQSDRRLKTSIMNIPNALCKINELSGVYFNWNECACKLIERNTNKREVGFIAQEVNEVLPEAVSYAAFDRNVMGESISGQNYLTVRYEKITPLLLEGIKELHCEMKELKCQINILKSK
jgi:hypothetical protein